MNATVKYPGKNRLKKKKRFKDEKYGQLEA